MSLNDASFEYVRTLTYERSAIVLEASKHYLVEARLTPLARDAGVSINDFVHGLTRTPFGALHLKVVEAMTTNETSFFRDSSPFEALRTLALPRLIERRAQTRTLQIWSGAASTGQEAYSIAMIIREHFPALANWTLHILGTDLSEEVLAKARAAQYGQVEINRGVPAPLLVKYFERHGLRWTVVEPIRRMVEFRHMNLVAPWPALPRMDIVFLRNVLIYFDAETKKTILRKVRSLLQPDGYLFLGGAETTINLDDALERVPNEKAVTYRLRAA
jgi:chemotaxis protein methyltransferase CheR